MSLQDLFHAANNGERLEDIDGNDSSANDSNRHVRDRDEIVNNINNHQQGIHPRPSIVPLDTLSRKERKIMMKSKSLTLPTLLRGNDLYFDTSIKLHRCILAGQLIRLITPSSSTEKIPWYAQKNGHRGASGQTNYDRLMFFRPIYEGSQEKVSMDIMFVVMQNSTTNNNLFNRFPSARDNGGFTIGSMIIFVNPKPIEKFMNGMPLLESQDLAILARPMVCTPIPFRNDLDANEMKVFHLKGSNLNLRTLTFVESKCSGLFCDRQNLEHGRKACGCFSHKSSRSCIAIQTNLLFTTQNTETRLMEKFSSHQFFCFLTKGFLSIDIRSSQLQNGNDAYDDIIDSIEDIFELINENGGWSITGWSKRGLINDAAILNSNNSGTSVTTAKDQADSNKVLSEEVTNHIVQIFPTRREYLNPSSDEGKEIEKMRFDLSSL